MTTLRENRNFYPPSIRPALVRGKEGAELFVTIGTRNCSYRKKTGGCKFCGLSLLDGDLLPLSISEAKKQMEVFFKELPESERRGILKVSLISMSDSLLNPKTIRPSALIEIANIIPKFLPNVVEASIETRADMAGKQALNVARKFFDELSKGLKISGLIGEIAVGIESARQEIRDSVNKGISDIRIEKLATSLGQLGVNLRGYFIYNLLERNDNVGELLRAVYFMARLREKTGVNPSILILRGYVPDGYRNAKFFKGFTDVPDETALEELRMPAKYAQKKGVKFEIDSTSEDQSATGADTLSQKYTSALKNYNLTFKPGKLCI